MDDSLPKKAIVAAETRPHLASLRLTENLAQNLLGFFDLKDTVTVFPDAHSNNGALLYTTHHEHSHQRIIRVTSFVSAS